jgi:hypothetical protein
MSNCRVISMPAKACSGRCKGKSCESAPRVWIVAACEGMVSLFEEKNHGTATIELKNKESVFYSVDSFKQFIDASEDARAFDKLILVGSANDIAWVHSSLSNEAARHIAAEIKYPLLVSWFKEPEQMPNFAQALKSVLAS